MKLIRPNNYLLFVQIFFLAAGLSISSCASGQNGSDDSTSVQVKADTATEEVLNYFDGKNGAGSFDTIELRHVPGYVMDSLKGDDAFWYANTRFKKKIEKESAG